MTVVTLSIDTSGDSQSTNASNKSWKTENRFNRITPGNECFADHAYGISPF